MAQTEKNTVNGFVSGIPVIQLQFIDFLEKKHWIFLHEREILFSLAFMKGVIITLLRYSNGMNGIPG